jgi:hypothetical protein
MKTTLIINLYDEEETTVSEKNYKEILTVLTYNVTISENDNEILDKRIEALAEKWYETEPKSQEAWNEMEKEWDKYDEQIKDNKNVIKKCEGAVKLIETFAEVEGWE